MLRKTFETEIQQVKDEVLVLGSMVEQAILNTVEALKKRDIKASEEILKADKLINQKRFDIENKLMILIATQQPMARDLRLLASCMEIISELERMGDYAKGIANINIRMGDDPLLKPLIDIPRMAQKDVDMLHRALTAFVNEDAETAKAIPVEDDEVDALYNQIYRELMTFIIQDPKTIERANWLLWVAHNLERVADRVTNICERTVFIVTGEMAEIKATDDEFWKSQKK
ncbi:MAG: phosphate signaling complex protein PhoU [Chloroflexota bacterium]|nr:phosphate signaling complex protein PhoU [Chloroflexota bacterium]MBI5703092.1 phosphate signaling complex protein PhoU [Chloroflexota bacterium]